MEKNTKIQSSWNEKWLRLDFGVSTKQCWYEISNFGRIKSIDKETEKEKLLKGARVRGGLITLNIKLKDESRGVVYVHRFVAENFVDQPSDDHEYIIHKDFNNNNNQWNNLEWVTQEEWKAHKESTPGKEKRKPNKNYKLTETQVRMMKKLLKRGKTKRKIIAKQFGVSENCAYKIEKGIRWAHVTIDDEEESEAENTEIQHQK
ncbi:MAG: NUMOD4 domain-containing protein [Saprospiraceae bacterium]|nr:NUMOD4 domain-containing protein [Saprospiraceae bacterium]